MLTLTTGTAFMMWVGEQITERGIGNGISLLIFAGIVDGIPEGVASYFATNKGNIQPLNLAAVVVDRPRDRGDDRLLRARRSARSPSTTRDEPSAGGSTAGRRRTCRSA